MPGAAADLQRSAGLVRSLPTGERRVDIFEHGGLALLVDGPLQVPFAIDIVPV